ncbi:hypothetical protein EAO75_28270 [Streptomyces sp. uw30]|uniref:hypothetical protein n=1 Tax=Streptomyces sp. uw30 TaxID=1828179 RepID=UPI0011CE3DAF|nr:hypothetical protein [Streptomyces sp. uw30]TXS46581.1 hypothetical protein EAO75_28270 [Streptomyces sp. uw30]
MVFRSIWQGLQSVLGGASGLNDDDVKAQAIQDPVQTKNLIEIENARGAMKLRLVTRVGMLGLVGLIVVAAVIIVVVQAAGELKLPWSRIGTIAVTVLGASGITGLVTRWWKKRLLARRQSAGATSENSSANPAEGDPNQVGTS